MPHGPRLPDSIPADSMDALEQIMDEQVDGYDLDQTDQYDDQSDDSGSED